MSALTGKSKFAGALAALLLSTPAGAVVTLNVYKSDGTTLLGAFVKFAGPCLIHYADGAGNVTPVVTDARRGCIDATLIYASSDCSGAGFVTDQGSRGIAYNGTTFYIADRSARQCAADGECTSGANSRAYASYRDLTGACITTSGETATYLAVPIGVCGSSRGDVCVVK